MTDSSNFYRRMIEEELKGRSLDEFLAGRIVRGKE